MIEIRIVETEAGLQYCWVPGTATVRVVQKQEDGSFKQTGVFNLDKTRAESDHEEPDSLGGIVNRLISKCKLMSVSKE